MKQYYELRESGCISGRSWTFQRDMLAMAGAFCCVCLPQLTTILPVVRILYVLEFLALLTEVRCRV
jgi:hypothetical protein